MAGRCPLCGQQLPHAVTQTAIESGIRKLAGPALAAEKKLLQKEFDSKNASNIQRALKNQERQHKVDIQRAEDTARIRAERDAKARIDRACKDTESRIKKEFAQSADLKLERERHRHAVEISRLQRDFDDLARKMEKQTSEQLGSEAEIDLLTSLRYTFPKDDIRPVSRGVKGADILHVVMDGHKVAGKIVYESKNTLQWNQSFIAQAKKHQLQYETPNVIVVTRAFPSKRKGFCIEKGIPVVASQMAVSLATVIREAIIEIAKLRLSSNFSNEKSLELYEYIVSDKFCTRFNEIEECVNVLREVQQKERNAHERVWQASSAIHDRLARGHREVDAQISMIVRSTKRFDIPKSANPSRYLEDFDGKKLSGAR